jgi:transposase
MGRPSKFDPDLERQAIALLELGATDKQLASFFKVSESTLNLWKQKFPKFSESLKKAKQTTDEKVEKSLYQRARGYKHKAVKIFCNREGQVTEVPYIERHAPDTTACIFWLKNRQPERWRDKQEIEHSGEVKTAVLELASGTGKPRKD